MFRIREIKKGHQTGYCPGRCDSGRVIDAEVDEDGMPIRLVDRGECPECDGEGSYGVSCAVCHKWTPDGEDLDFHHWDYESHKGILVCRECHDCIHSTDDAYPGSDGWVKIAAENAVKRAMEKRTDEDSKTDMSEILGWLHLPDSIEQEFR